MGRASNAARKTGKDFDQMQSSRSSRPIQKNNRTSSPSHPIALRCRICGACFPARRGEPYGRDSDRVLDHLERRHPLEVLSCWEEYELLRLQEASWR